VQGHEVEGVDAFSYLGSVIHSSGQSLAGVLRRIGITSNCMNNMSHRVVTIQAVPLHKAVPLSNLHSTNSSKRFRDLDEVRNAETTDLPKAGQISFL